jgi:hypothetical protein
MEIKVFVSIRGPTSIMIGLGKFMAYQLSTAYRLISTDIAEPIGGRWNNFFFFNKFGSVGEIKFVNRTDFIDHLQTNFANNFQFFQILILLTDFTNRLLVLGKKFGGISR